MGIAGRFLNVALAALVALVLGSAATDATTVAAPPVRPHDTRHFTVDVGALPFEAVADSTVHTDRWWGVEGGAGYRVEVPEHWNGRLVMYAHGYRGNGDTLTPAAPHARRELIEAGYAWAASSYSANNYDVRAGIEDTNALALAFTRIARANGRALAAPERIYIIGHSMGGHIAAAAVEAETLASERHKVRYAGAMPMCGVLADFELFNYYAAYSLAAQKLSGEGAVEFPAAHWDERAPKIIGRLFASFPSDQAPTTPIVIRDTPEARELKAIVMNLSGGERPVFEQGFALSSNASAWFALGLDTSASGLLLHRPQSTEHVTYRFSSAAAPTEEELAFNRSMPRIVPEPDANPRQPGALRYVPLTNGEISVPVLTLHNLGDVFVPFRMEQVYRERVEKHGNGRFLVQRAIRSPLHCDFTAAEEDAGFRALVAWVEHGTRPAGDEVTNASTLADPGYGCAFTDNRTGSEDGREGELRATMPACPAAH